MYKRGPYRDNYIYAENPAIPIDHVHFYNHVGMVETYREDFADAPQKRYVFVAMCFCGKFIEHEVRYT